MKHCFADSFRGKKILVTGHTGFKGSWLSIWLRELGAEVIGYSLEPPTTPSNFELCDLANKMTHIVGNVCDREHFKQVVSEHCPEIVFHLAAQPIVLTSYQDPHETFQSNVMGTTCVLDAIRQCGGVKVFIGVTSDKVYKDQGWYWGYRESDSLGGYDPYSASKAATEIVIASYRQSWNQQWQEHQSSKQFAVAPTAIASVRAGNVIGGGDFADFRILPDFMKACIAGEPMILRNPNSIRPWQHALEPLSGYLLLAAKMLAQPDAYNEAWNFGPAEREPIVCESLVKLATELWGNGCQGYITPKAVTAAHETQVLRVNWDQAAYRLRWMPTYSWQEAVTETVTWWKAYQAQCLAAETPNMYQVCVDHIQTYVDKAKQQQISWTH